MSRRVADQKPVDANRETRARDHLANERTLLAWVRTAIALMGLGFVVARFGLFLRELTAQTIRPVEWGALNLSSPLGISMVAAGLLAMALATIRYLRARDQIERGSFQPEAFAQIVVVVLTLLGGAALLIYLVLVS